MKKFTAFSLIAVVLLAACAAFPAPVRAQDRPSKPPVLIREEVDRAPDPVEPDPEQAERELEVGDFYFKRENFAAAAGRYREALVHRPGYSPAYEKLIQALQKNGEMDEARRLMKEYIQRFPQSPRTAEYRRALNGARP